MAATFKISLTPAPFLLLFSQLQRLQRQKPEQRRRLVTEQGPHQHGPRLASKPPQESGPSRKSCRPARSKAQGTSLPELLARILALCDAPRSRKEGRKEGRRMVVLLAAGGWEGLFGNSSCSFLRGRSRGRGACRSFFGFRHRRAEAMCRVYARARAGGGSFKLKHATGASPLSCTRRDCSLLVFTDAGMMGLTPWTKLAPRSCTILSCVRESCRCFFLGVTYQGSSLQGCRHAPYVIWYTHVCRRVLTILSTVGVCASFSSYSRPPGLDGRVLKWCAVACFQV